MEQNQQQPKKGSNKAVVIILIIMIALLGGAGGYLGFLYMGSMKMYEGIKADNTKLQDTVKIKNTEIENMKIELEKLAGAVPKTTYDSLMNRVTQLEADLQAAQSSRVVYTGGGGGSTKLKKEIEDLKAELEKLKVDYAAAIKDRDKYKTDAEKLTTDNTNLSQEKTDLAIKNKGLQDKVDVASQLKFYNTMLTGYKLDKKGKKTFEEKAKKVMGLEVSFKIQANDVADEGERMAYIVITGPDKKVMAVSTANVFQVGGVDKVYSVQKSFYFNNKEAEIAADFKTAETVKPGEYTAEIYVDGKLCGTAVNYLKK